MSNYYSTVDDILLTVSNIELMNGFDCITVRFEHVNARWYQYFGFK